LLTRGARRARPATSSAGCSRDRRPTACPTCSARWAAVVPARAAEATLPSPVRDVHQSRCCHRHLVRSSRSPCC